MGAQEHTRVQLMGPNGAVHGFVGRVDKDTPIYVEVDSQRRQTYHLDETAHDALPMYRFQGDWTVKTLPLPHISDDRIVVLADD